MSNDAVVQFFNAIAPHYARRLRHGRGFHHYFFEERLREATRELDFDNKKILDIGAGTGALHDWLLQKSPDYYACDLAAEMLAQSAIPLERRWVGRAEDLDFGVEKFDLTFLLGVSTYMTEEELQRTLAFIKGRLAEGGTAVLSFTNRASWHWKGRWLIRRFLKGWARKRVVGQAFSILAYSPEAVEGMVAADFVIQKRVFLNLTLPVLNRLIPGPLFWLSDFLRRQRLSAKWQSRFGSDFLVFLATR